MWLSKKNKNANNKNSLRSLLKKNPLSVDLVNWIEFIKYFDLSVFN